MKAASKIEGTAAKISREITPRIEKPLNEVISNGQRLNHLPSQDKMNPFKGKTFEEIDSFLKQKGFTTKGPDPMNGKGSYFHPLSNRKYYLDHAGKTYRN